MSEEQKTAQKQILEKLRQKCKLIFEGNPSTEYIYGKILPIIDQLNSEI